MASLACKGKVGTNRANHMMLWIVPQEQEKEGGRGLSKLWIDVV